jgi:hypothetical protein
VGQADRPPAPRVSSVFLAPGDAYFVVESDSVNHLVVVRRTERAFETLDDATRAHEAVVEKLSMLSRRAFCLLVDLRSAPLRSDPEFEEAIAPVRKRLFSGFARTAVIVRTAAGRMQVSRHLRSDGVDPNVYVEENEAIAFLQMPASKTLV